mmetsp:Transcript_13680/g.43217  ORF Transcript_13680/g.43217 Transcript_13680/m.43217 type:complete len:306 (-) Transcript_13680:952-1869(-)
MVQRGPCLPAAEPLKISPLPSTPVPPPSSGGGQPPKDSPRRACRARSPPQAVSSSSTNSPCLSSARSLRLLGRLATRESMAGFRGFPLGNFPLGSPGGSLWMFSAELPRGEGLGICPLGICPASAFCSPMKGQSPPLPPLPASPLIRCAGWPAACCASATICMCSNACSIETAPPSSTGGSCDADAALWRRLPGRCAARCASSARSTSGGGGARPTKYDPSDCSGADERRGSLRPAPLTSGVSAVANAGEEPISPNDDMRTPAPCTARACATALAADAAAARCCTLGSAPPVAWEAARACCSCCE